MYNRISLKLSVDRLKVPYIMLYSSLLMSRLSKSCRCVYRMPLIEGEFSILYGPRIRPPYSPNGYPNPISWMHHLDDSSIVAYDPKNAGASVYFDKDGNRINNLRATINDSDIKMVYGILGKVIKSLNKHFQDGLTIDPIDIEKIYKINRVKSQSALIWVSDSGYTTSIWGLNRLDPPKRVSKINSIQPLETIEEEPLETMSKEQAVRKTARRTIIDCSKLVEVPKSPSKMPETLRRKVEHAARLGGA